MKKILRPGLLATILLLPLALFLIKLGLWQMDRADEKAALIYSFEHAPLLVLNDITAATPRYTKVSGFGQFDRTRHLLLDNQVFEGRAGAHVYTPFIFDDGRHLLVNRGWIPMSANRIIPPDLATPIEQLQISGRLNLPARPGRQLGATRDLETGTWPQLVTYLDLSRAETALGLSLLPLVLQLDEDSQGGFSARNWSPVNFGPDRHFAYALQWFALALTVFTVYLLLARLRAQEAIHHDIS